jgi:hypothetical protein
VKVPILPDVSRLVSAYLRFVPEVRALVGDRVYTAFPKQVSKSSSFVLVTRIGGPPVLTRPLVLDLAVMQLDAYGGPQSAAHELVATCRAALAELEGEQPNAGGNVTGVVVGALRYVPDETYKPPRPRYVSDLEVYVKPAGELFAGVSSKPAGELFAGANPLDEVLVEPI